jgi:transcriptional regulator with XRE-family HTH domain
LKKEKMSQNELAKQIGVYTPMIGRYEKSEVKPSIDVTIKIVNALAVTIDYLAGKTDFELDNDPLKRIQDVSTLPPEEKKQVFMVINAL